MVQTFFERSFAINRLRKGPLSGHIDLLAAREFGEGAIFRDVDSIRSGGWESRIETALKNCSVFPPRI